MQVNRLNRKLHVSGQLAQRDLRFRVGGQEMPINGVTLVDIVFVPPDDRAAFSLVEGQGILIMCDDNSMLGFVNRQLGDGVVKSK